MTARQLGFACDPVGAVVLVGDRVGVRCPDCGEPVDGSFVVARTFKTGSVAVFNTKGKQRHLRYRRFALAETTGAPA